MPCIFFFDRFKTSEEKEAVKNSRKTLWIGGILCGAILFVATNAQQIGIQYTSAGKAGFITALYIVFVPIIGIFLKKKCSWNVWVSVVTVSYTHLLKSVRQESKDGRKQLNAPLVGQKKTSNKIG